jgi:tRNA pseudouridine55 synthase
MTPGFLLIDKPTDWTSHDVVGYLRGVTREKTIGHAGTLDPFATGLLIVGVGREATKQLNVYTDMPKPSETTIRLGATSDTDDLTGGITEHPDAIPPSPETIQQVIESFVGPQLQVPSMYSAKKINGVKLYELAREGKTVERPPNPIEIFSIELLSYTYPNLTIRVQCSPGTYIRTLAHDIGEKLGTFGYCETLRRTAIGPYSVEGTMGPKALSRDNFLDFLTPLDKIS